MKRLAILCGLIGPIFFAVVVTGMTILKYDFLRGLGWHPLHYPTFDWPSGLALGPYGGVMTTTFIFSGLMMSIFALRLGADLATVRRTSFTSARIGSILFALAGLAMAGLAFTTDPTIRSTPATWHGRLHDASFVSLGLTLLPAMIFLGCAFQNDPRWSRLAPYTWITAALILPAFILKGIAFYLFLAGVLLWCEVVAWQLHQLFASRPHR
jgi:hypothetical protein